MKRKYNLLVLPAVVIIAISIFSGFTGQSDTDYVKSLLEQRTDVLQKGFYGQTLLDETEKKLVEIETYPLLTEDIENLREWEASELDIVNQMNFIKVEKTHNFLRYKTYNVTISWDMRSLSENYTMRGDYYVVLKKDGLDYKLSQFNPR